MSMMHEGVEVVETHRTCRAGHELKSGRSSVKLLVERSRLINIDFDALKMDKSTTPLNWFPLTFLE
jgi:predicted nuclease with RNAse H fold